ncbi:hypothetical protein Hanom_Chr08g00728491 [Helianthus anomalus]
MMAAGTSLAAFLFAGFHHHNRILNVAALTICYFVWRNSLSPVGQRQLKKLTWCL